MAMTQRDTVVGVFDSHSAADRAVEDLRRAGFREDQIGIAGRDVKDKDGGDTYASEGALAGAVAGAGVGGLVALGVLSGIIPVIGPAIAAGTLGVILANAAGGAAIASLVGALIGMGIPEEEAKYYEGELHSGRYLVTVKGGTRHAEVWQILQRHGAHSHEHRQKVSATATGTRAEGQNITLHEEQLHARKQSVETGEVRVRKEVVSETQTLNVPVQREEIVIERRPASGQHASTGDMRAGEEIRIPVKEERVRVEKDVVVKEEVTVGKRKIQENEQVSGTVRKEEVRVESEGDVNVRDTDKKNRGKSR